MCFHDYYYEERIYIIRGSNNQIGGIENGGLVNSSNNENNSVSARLASTNVKVGFPLSLVE